MDLVRWHLHMASSWKFQPTIKDYLAAVYDKHTTSYDLRLPIHHHSADYISFPLGSLSPLWYI